MMQASVCKQLGFVSSFGRSNQHRHPHSVSWRLAEKRGQRHTARAQFAKTIASLSFAAEEKEWSTAFAIPLCRSIVASLAGKCKCRMMTSLLHSFHDF